MLKIQKVSFKNNMRYLTAITFIACTVIGTMGVFSIGKGIFNIKGNRHIVHVKGLAEQNVTANYAIWSISSQVSKSRDYQIVKRNALDTYNKILDFLKKNGFQDDEIIKVPLSISVEYLKIKENDILKEDELPTYSAHVKLDIQTKNTQTVQNAFSKVNELIDQDISVYGTPRFVIQNFDQFRPKLIEKAAESALRVAEQICSKVGRKIGKLRQADQGSIRILNPNTDESYTANDHIDQKLRVVSTFIFELE